MPEKKIGVRRLLDTTSLKSKQDLYNILKRLPEGKFSITIDTYEPLMSTGQRGYYWKYLMPECSQLNGEESNWWHEFFKKRFLLEDRVEKGKRVEKVRSTSSLTLQEAEAYYSQIRRFIWDEYQVCLRLPNEYGPINIYNQIT